MRDGRLACFIGGLGFGYLHTGLVVIAGLWLTPFMLARLGEHRYGLWLLAAQFLTYLGLLDLGITALVPRELARERGTAGDVDAPAITAFVDRTTSIVLWQTPAVAVVGLAVYVMIPVSWSELKSPMALVVTAFVILFPLRLLSNLLQGLQDLTYLGGIQLSAWLAGTVTTIALLVAGLGLYAVAGGWVVTQSCAAMLAWRRLRVKFPSAVPRYRLSRPIAAVGPVIQRGLWVTVNQIAQVLLNGTELVVIGMLLGPSAVVIYSCTGRLQTLLANQPQMFMQMAIPALSELRAQGSRQRLFDVSTALNQVMLLGSGAIAGITFLVNQGFVAWWVGTEQFGGPLLTVSMLTAMMLRHWNLTASYSLYSAGYERHLAATAVVDGFVTLSSMFVLIPWLGMSGAAVASIVGVGVVSLPVNLRAVAREQDVSFAASLAPLRAWTVRFGIFAVGVVGLSFFWSPSNLTSVLVTAAAVALSYLVVMRRVLAAPPAGPILATAMRPWLGRLRTVTRREPESAAAA